MDFLLIAYGILTVVLYVPPDVSSKAYQHTSVTNVLRETVLYILDIYALYYVASRSCSSRRAILDVFAAFCLSCTIMATTAVFESVKHWLLYVDLYARWGGDLMNTAYFVRAGLLRAVASSGNALVLGYLLAIALGLWLCIQSHVTKVGPRIAVGALLWLGLLASFSRGPMLGALLIYLAYAAVRAGSMSRLIKSVALALVVIAVTLASPIGDPIMKTLPFMGGKVATGSLDYREVVLARSWDLIEAHPFFGDQLAFAHLQDLRQGQGIIDLVNTYVGVTVFHGLIGLMIFLGFFLSGLLKSIRGGAQDSAARPRLGPRWRKPYRVHGRHAAHACRLQLHSGLCDDVFRARRRRGRLFACDRTGHDGNDPCRLTGDATTQLNDAIQAIQCPRRCDPRPGFESGFEHARRRHEPVG